jgi:hypothetical protein
MSSSKRGVMRLLYEDPNTGGDSEFHDFWVALARLSHPNAILTADAGEFRLLSTTAFVKQAR